MPVNCPPRPPARRTAAWTRVGMESWLPPRAGRRAAARRPAAPPGRRRGSAARGADALRVRRLDGGRLAAQGGEPAAAVEGGEGPFRDRPAAVAAIGIEREQGVQGAFDPGLVAADGREQRPAGMEEGIGSRGGSRHVAQDDARGAGLSPWLPPGGAGSARGALRP